jgi:hypothetical protein
VVNDDPALGFGTVADEPGHLETYGEEDNVQADGSSGDGSPFGARPLRPLEQQI